MQMLKNRSAPVLALEDEEINRLSCDSCAFNVELLDED